MGDFEVIINNRPKLGPSKCIGLKIIPCSIEFASQLLYAETEFKTNRPRTRIKVENLILSA